MTLIKHELRQNKISLAVWAAGIGFLLVICVLIYPEMESDMDSMNDLFSSMGAFTEAFGMDRLNFGEFMGFYSVECGNILGLGGAFFAALLGISALAKEEKEHTAEFLLTHPVRRARVVTEKLCSVFLNVLILNAAVLLAAILSIFLIGESPDWKPLLLLHLSNTLLQLEIGFICFGVSAFLRRGGPGTGMGIAIGLYFLNLLANITDSMKTLKYITPFSYTEGADILSDGCLRAEYVLVGAVCAVLGIAVSYRKYCGKDIC